MAGPGRAAESPGTVIGIRREVIGISAGHRAQAARPVEEYVLDAGPGIGVTVWTYGATLVEVRVPDRGGRIGNVTLRLPDLASYEDPRRGRYVGSVLGRFCRIVADGRFRLDGTGYLLDRNDGSHHLHGGSIGFDRFVWDAEAGRDGDAAAIRLRLTRPDGDQGYPGAVSAQVGYAVRPEGQLIIDYSATTTASTIIGLTSHAFWNLAGSGRVDDHQLVINAGHHLPAGPDLIPLAGPPRGIAGTGLDYRTARPLRGRALDDFFVLADPSWAAQLHDPVTGRVLSLRTDQPGLGVYTADMMCPPRAGLCLQASAWPDAPNRADYPSCRLDPGEVYHQRTELRFTLR